MRKLVTHRIGAIRLGDAACFDARIVRSDDEPSFFTMVGGSLSKVSHPSLDAALAALAADYGRHGEVTWRSSCDPEAGEAACFVCGVFCGARLEARSRYPEELCPACVREAVDEKGRSIEFHNSSLAGGFAARCVATGEDRRSHVCFVRGTKCWADEARFGGIVVVPFERR